MRYLNLLELILAQRILFSHKYQSPNWCEFPIILNAILHREITLGRIHNLLWLRFHPCEEYTDDGQHFVMMTRDESEFGRHESHGQECLLWLKAFLEDKKQRIKIKMIMYVVKILTVQHVILSIMKGEKEIRLWNKRLKIKHIVSMNVTPIPTECNH